MSEKYKTRVIGAHNWSLQYCDREQTSSKTRAREINGADEQFEANKTMLIESLLRLPGSMLQSTNQSSTVEAKREAK